MALSMWQLASPINVKYISFFKALLIMSTLASLISLNGCQTLPSTEMAATTANQSQSLPASVITANTTKIPVIDNNEYTDSYEDNDPIEPYIKSEEITTPYQTPIRVAPTIIANPSFNDDPIVAPSPTKTVPPLVPPSHNELLERARQTSKQQSRQPASDKSALPAFRNLMQTGIDQLKAGNLTAAESTFTRAQRLAPKSSAVYFYLAQVALKKNQPRKAEAMARRGLNVAEDASRRRSLWQLILRSGQLQNNQRVINEAQKALH